MTLSDEKRVKRPTPRPSAAHTEGAKRLIYTRPQLKFYGNVSEMTASGSVAGMENMGKFP